MKKLFKGFMTTLFVGIGLFSGINTLKNEKKEIVQQIDGDKTTIIKNTNYKVYNLKPGQIFNPNSSEFDSYWNIAKRYNGSEYRPGGFTEWLIAIERVTDFEDNYYEISFDYSVWSTIWGGYDLIANLFLSNPSNSYQEEFYLGPITNKNTGQYSTANKIIKIPKWSVSEGENLTFRMEFRFGNYHFKSTANPSFDLIGYEYLDDFYISSFNVLNDSITDSGFEFLVDLRFVNGNPFIPFANNLILYSNGMPLITEFKNYQGSLLRYQVSGLQKDSVYMNFSVGIIGFNDTEKINSFMLSTKSDEVADVGVIVGSTIGGIILLLLILLIILLLLKRRKKVVEYNYYHNYRTFVDQQGNYIEMNQEEYDALDEDVAAQYEEVDTSELLDGHYEYQ